MAGVDLVDESFIAVGPEVLAPIVADPERWARWWPDLQLAVFMDRGLEGMRWSTTGALHGSCELWLERSLDGTIVHHYLRGDPGGSGPWPDTPAGWRKAAAERARRARRWKQHVWALKDEVEGDRRPGEPPTPPQR
ncbi:MAG: polyketide cyclase / dehydrase and lipid transport [Candidatus Nanopelagicales bacterium]